MTISRRKIITAIATAPVATAATILPFIAISAATNTPDPIIDLYRQWRCFRDQWMEKSELDASVFSEEKLGAISDTEFDIAHRVGDMTATTPEALVCQLQILWVYYGPISLKNSRGYEEEMKYPENILLKSILDGAEKMIKI